MLRKNRGLQALIAFLLIVLLPLSSFGKGKVFNITKGTKAPFSGTLFDINAAADLTVKLESQEAQCKLRIEKTEEICKNEKAYQISLKIAEIEALQTRHDDILKIKNDQIEFLQKKSLDIQPWYKNNTFWVSVGIVIGMGIAYGSAAAWGQVAD